MNDILNDLKEDDVDPLTGDVQLSGSFKNFTRMTCNDFIVFKS